MVSLSLIVTVLFSMLFSRCIPMSIWKTAFPKADAINTMLPVKEITHQQKVDHCVCVVRWQLHTPKDFSYQLYILKKSLFFLLERNGFSVSGGCIPFGPPVK
jgi:hypothetical protein